MRGYCKLSGNLINSSVWDESDAVRIVWITLLAMSDATGFVASSLPGLAHQCRKTREETISALQVLEAPDPDSQNPDHEGRRITKVEGGWLIFNYVLHRAQEPLSDDPEAIATRERVRRFRERKKAEKTQALQDVTVTLHPVTGVTPASASASASAFEKKKSTKSTVRTTVNGLIDSEWIASLKEDETYQGLDVDRELGKMQNWCKVRGLTPSRRRFVSWLNRDRPISEQPQISPHHRQNRINFFNEKKQKLNRMIKDPQNPPPWIVKQLSEIDSQLQKL